MEYRVLAAVLAALLLAGCNAPAPAPSPPPATTPGPADPFAGQTLTILDHGAFGGFEDAKKLFENRTGATVVHIEADDSGSALQRAVLEKGDPTFDIIYGIDNILWARAMEEGIFEPYTPNGSARVDPAYLFFDANGTWPATPVDHGYIGINVDPVKLNRSVTSFDDLKAFSREFVTEDPRTSTPGLGFLLATIAVYGEAGWKDYWTELFSNGVLVTSGWTEAYEQHFSAGYGVGYGGAGDKAIVTSYTTSPAYEAYFGRNDSELAVTLVAPETTFHQIQTMGIAKGTRNLALAHAWIDFTLSDEFQALAAPGNAVYPVVASVSTDDVYGERDPAPGSFQPAQLESATIGANLERWLGEWTDLCEEHDCA
jgi:thiamine transport system substrate-binding protein